MATKKTSKVIKSPVFGGKRKRAVAKAAVTQGIGRVRVNSKLLGLVEPEIARQRISEPLILSGELAKTVNVDVTVSGGGWASQADAARLSIARALYDFSKSEDLKKKFLEYDRHLIVADTRRKEQRKPMTHSHARSKRQLSYR